MGQSFLQSIPGEFTVNGNGYEFVEDIWFGDTETISETISESELEGSYAIQNDESQSGEQISSEAVSRYLNEHQAEFIQALLPALSAALPTILPMVASALPGIVQGVSSIFGGGARPPAPPQQQPIQHQAVYYAPPPQPQPLQTTIPVTPVQNASGSSIQALVQLLQNPQVLSAITNLASGLSQSAPTNTGSSIPTKDILATVSQLSSTVATPQARPGESESIFAEYVFDSKGKLLIDPSDPVQKASLIAQLLN